MAARTVVPLYELKPEVGFETTFSSFDKTNGVEIKTSTYTILMFTAETADAVITVLGGYDSRGIKYEDKTFTVVAEGPSYTYPILSAIAHASTTTSENKAALKGAQMSFKVDAVQATGTLSIAAIG